MNTITKLKYFIFGVLFGMAICLSAFVLTLIVASPTPTPTASLTRIPPFTETQSHTPTATYTRTITPFPAIIDTSTKTYTPTNTQAPTVTRTPSKTPTITKTPDKRILYNELDIRELATYPNNHIGEMVVVRGRVFNINGNKELQVWLDYNYTYALYAIFNKEFSGIYENDWIYIYGTVYGEECGTNAFGGEVCQAVLIADFFEK